MAKATRDGGTYELITPPNHLKTKVAKSASSGFDAALLSRAAAAIDNLREDFEGFVLAEAKKLGALSRELAADRGKAEAIGQQAFLIGHEIGGQGATFGYDLATEIGLSLCRYVERLGRPENLSDEVLRAHADALRAVVGNRIDGTGGAAGADLIRELGLLVDRMSR